MRTRRLASCAVLALSTAALLLSSLPASVVAESNGGYHTAFKVLGSDSVPINGAVGTVILNVACYGCGTLSTVPVDTAVSDSSGIIGINLPVGSYTMQIVKPGGGIYIEFNFNIPQTATMTIRLSQDSNTIQKELKQNPINLKDYIAYNAFDVVGIGNDSVDWKSWFLPSDTFAGLYTLALMQNVAGYQQTKPIYVLPYTSPPAMLFGIAVLAIALESTSQVARKKRAKSESNESVR